MKNSKLFFAVMLGLVITTGCSKWDQDPMKNQDKTLGDGLPAPTVPTPQKPTASDAVKVDTVESFSFKMGVTDEFKIGARVLLPDYAYDIQIDNLNEFPGAKYDAATGVFTWTPDANVIPAKEMSVELTLQVSAVARIPNKPDAAVLLGSKQVKITVNRVLTAPEVSSITANSGTKIREGSYSSVTVLIDDANATSDQSTWPTLIISNPTGKASLAAFTKLNSMTQLPNGQIQATLYIDLSNAELTKSTDSYGLVMKAISAFNKMGTEKSIDFTVMTQLSEPTTTWTSTISAALGTKLDYQFMILDPKSEGVFDQITFSGVPTGAQASCTYVTDSTQSCHLVWTVPANQAIGTVSFSATAVLKNVDYYADSQTSRQVFKYSISVVKSAPVPSQGDLK